MKRTQLKKIIKECIKEVVSSNALGIGAKAKIAGGSGTDSNKTVTIVDKSNIKTDGRGIPTNVSGAYKPIDWSKEVAIQYEDGKFGTMFKNRLQPINFNQQSHAPEMRVGSDEPTSPYHPNSVAEHFGDDDVADAGRADDTSSERIKGTIAYTDKASNEVLEFDYIAHSESYKGSVEGVEIDEISPVNGSPEFDSLSPEIQAAIEAQVKTDASENL